MSTTTPIPEQIVSVPVPVQHLPAVYQLLAELTLAPNHPSTDEPSVLIDDAQGVWTLSMIRRLHANLNQEGARLMLSLVAGSAPDEVAMQAGVEAWAGHTHGHLRAQMGALSKITKNLFGRKTWPMHVRYDEQGQAYYSMPEEIAEWWKAEGIDA